MKAPSNPTSPAGVKLVNRQGRLSWCDWSSPTGLKGCLNKEFRSLRQAGKFPDWSWMGSGYDTVAFMREFVAHTMSVADMYDLIKMPFRKREKHLEMLSLAGEVEMIRRGARSLPALEDKLKKLKAELAAM